MPHARLILASSSPRRRELLAEAGYAFEVVPPAESAETGPQSSRLAPRAVREADIDAAPADGTRSVPATMSGQIAGEIPAAYVARLAYQKAADVAARIDAGLIIACDTVAECGGQILGKPADEADARRMLHGLRGREHHVYSGLCLWPRPEGEPQVRVACTRLQMDDLSDAQIEEYLASGHWEGKAGAFGYQDRLGWVHVVEGSESNVVGLPMELLAAMLEEFEHLPASG
jgi:septum formation protein